MPKRLELAGLRELIEQMQWTQHHCAAHFGCHVSAIERRCKQLGLSTQRTGPRSGKGHPNWKGGRILIGGVVKYWHLYMPDHPMATAKGYVSEHRFLMSEKLGRLLDSKEVVHHLNGDPQDNRLSNLHVFSTNAEHLRHELTGRIPNWTPEGRKAMLAGVRKARTRSA